MAYSSEISRNNPSCFVFLIDQSGSMDETLDFGKTKAQFVADVLNKTIGSIITRCTKDPSGIPRDYFEIAVITYSGKGVSCGLTFQKLSEIYENPLKIEERIKKIDDGAGGLVEQKIKFPIWFEPVSSGGTPMCEAFAKTANILKEWCKSHSDSYPPTVINVTDGESSDGNPEEITSEIRNIVTNDGNCLLYNLHVNVENSDRIAFPDNESCLPTDSGKLLFRISSSVPDNKAIISAAKEHGFTIKPESKFFFYKADMEFIVKFFEIGTSPGNNR